MQRGKKLNRQLDVYVGTLLLNVLATFHPRRKPPSRIQRIGVMCSAALGDTLLFSAALQDLRAARPDAHIVHICFKQNLAAAEIIPGADERVQISLLKPFGSIRTLRALKLDVLLDFTSWQRLTALYTLLSGAKYTVGFSTAGQRRSRGYDRTVEHSPARHEVENFRFYLQGCGLEPPIAGAHAPAVVVDPPSSPLFPEEDDIICFHLWASGQRSWLREWPEDRWIELAQHLAHPNTLFLITGAPSDRSRSLPFVEKMRRAGLRCESFTSPDGFRTLTNLLRRSRLVVSVNTGVMHLAAIANAPTVAINGPNRNGRWGPVGLRAAGVEAPGNGCGYLHLGFEFDAHATDCMDRISVDQVYAAAIALLSKQPG